MTKIIEQMNRFVWGAPALILIIGIGLYLSIRTRFVQLIYLPRAIRLFWKRLRCRGDACDGTSAYQALCTALAATVGTGNLAGVAGAIAIGGPGSIFWMWICGILGMVTKFAEATLAVRYRERNADGEFVGGPMYMIRKGIGKRWSWLGGIYCFFGVVAAFGVGNATQINTVIGGINTALVACGGRETHVGNIIMGAALAILIALLFFGGAKRIGMAAERLVPAASVIYLVLGIGVLLLRMPMIPSALQSVVKGAFSPKAVTGGVLGSAFAALRIGASRGVFTNEAGMGTASIAHAAAQVDHSVEQGLMGIMEVFLDTIVICTVTALVILCSGVAVPYGIDVGVQLTTDAFSHVYGHWVSVLIAIILCLFAIGTVLGWGLYGARCAQYLFGEGAWRTFAGLQVGAVILGAVMRTETVWMLAETINGLMAIPNLIALTMLTPELVRLTNDYKRKNGRLNAGGETYENFDQCKSLRTVTYAKVPSTGNCSRKER